MIAPHIPNYAELHALSSFSFQCGASQPKELVERAHALGYRALAITDECSVAGLVLAHMAAKKNGLQLLPGTEFKVRDVDGLCVIVLPHNLNGWGNLCEFITAARHRTGVKKGSYRLDWKTAQWASLQDCEVLLRLPPALSFEAALAIGLRAKALFADNLWLTVTLGLGADDALQQQRLRQLSAVCGVSIVASGNVHMHTRSRKPLHDVLTAIRLGTPVADCGFALQPNAELHLRSRERLGALYPAQWLANTLEIARRCSFSLEELRYHYPMEAVLPGTTPAQTLRHYVEEGARERYPDGMKDDIRERVEKELALISELRFEMYFLTVHDIVRYARSIHILCQGRGSAANSVVCYCLHVTEANPAETTLLFERFISRERNEPPDIDIDFEHQRREEVIQYIYEKYGRERAAIAATVISYRPRSALRDVGHALAIPAELITAMAKEHPGMYSREVLAERLEAAVARLGPDFVAPPARTLELWLAFAIALQGFPRHLSQHVGGFVLTDGPLTRLVPVENASMKDRSIIQWDKDDLSAVGLMKVDVLALGMLSAIRRCLEMVGASQGQPNLRMQDLPRDDTATYDMICAADTVGVFQIESRAQMSMLPRLRPRTYYDLVIEVAIVRPGPIQGGMIHPFLKARKNPTAPSEFPALDQALGRTHGIPIFQEQVMQIAVIAAGFTPGEADALRRGMAAWKRHGNVDVFEERLIQGMTERKYPREFAERIFKQIRGFGDYGFPESHAASFAILVYISSYLKCHHPACFLASLLNSQPLGFYGPAQLVQDARRHGVTVRPADVAHSDWDCTLEPLEAGETPAASDAVAVRLGLRLVGGLEQAVAQRIAHARTQSPFASTQDLALRCQLDVGDLRALAGGDALLSLSGHRRQQVWDASALRAAPALLAGVPIHEAALALPAAPQGEEVVFDYATLGLSLRCHPVKLLRAQLTAMRMNTAAQMRDWPSGRLARACGIVTARQRPQTAKGVVFMTIEDETGSVNVIVWKAVREQFRYAVYQARLLAVYGVWQRDDESGEVRNLVAKRLVDLTPMLGELSTTSRDFH